MRRHNLTALSTSIMNRNWYEVHKHLHEANLPDITNTYALHVACNDPTTPIKIVSEIYCMYPMAALQKDSHHDTPISIAIEAGFEDAVYFLASVCPQSIAICDSHGSTPILSAILSLKHNNMIDSMIISNPKAAFIRNEEGYHAFDYFFQHWNVFMRIAVSNPILYDQFLDSFIGHGDWKIRDVYQKACLFLKMAYLNRRGKILDDRFLLHCSLREESCHWAFSKLIMKLHPEQMFIKDDDGNLPLQIITSSNEICDQNTFLCFDCFTKDSALIFSEFINADSKYCCQYCFERESAEPETRAFLIRPGT